MYTYGPPTLSVLSSFFKNKTTERCLFLSRKKKNPLPQLKFFINIVTPLDCTRYLMKKFSLSLCLFYLSVVL